MTDRNFSKLTALILSFFLLSGFTLVGPDYKELYQKLEQKAQYLQEQLEDYKNQSETLRQKLDNLREENNKLGNNISSIRTENEILKEGLDPLQKALIEKEKRLNQRQEELNQERETLNQARASFNEEIRKMGQLEGELTELRQDKENLNQSLNELKAEQQKAENGKNWWKNFAFIEPVFFILIWGIVYLIRRQTQPQSYPQQQTIDLGENYANNKQLSEETQENKSLPKSEEN
ncbi:Prefoldin beta- domain protein [Halothece sp. PCC 7418]|uniref:prefoldin beta- domain-containing protein n=1 Tax=Halothece sp. (strain PCC 7418) TaxID=65093 RepID=UPI0002A07B00|nr:prefoldin beta- domain-containing protein [Halothece sp. PCC 7418]AFZ42508.1 Prefoldin beta- domain protein [Halothece sp. PCC 7418]